MRIVPLRQALGSLVVPDRLSSGHHYNGKTTRQRVPNWCHPRPGSHCTSNDSWFVFQLFCLFFYRVILILGSHGTTFGGSPIGTRLGHHVLSRLSESSFTAHATSVAQQLDARLAPLQDMFPNIIAGPTRGRGLLRGVPFKNEADPAKIVKLARERGVLLLTAGKDAIRLVPSLNVGSEEVNHAMDVFESCLYVLEQQA